MLVSEVSSVEEWKERQIKSGRWQSMTPEQQSSSIRHQKEEHIAPEEIAKMATTAGVKTVVLPICRPPPIQKTNANVLVRISRIVSPVHGIYLNIGIDTEAQPLR